MAAINIMSHSTSQRSATESRALKLLGSGYTPATVAAACGVTESRISQLLSEDGFAEEVATLRFQSLEKYNEIDSTYDTLEKKLLKQLEDVLPLLMRPLEIAKVLGVLNAAKRRGATAPEQIHSQSTVVNLVMPNVIVQKFTTNINNQVIQAGEQTLETIQSNTLLGRSKQKKLENTSNITDVKESSYVQATKLTNGSSGAGSTESIITATTS